MSASGNKTHCFPCGQLLISTVYLASVLLNCDFSITDMIVVLSHGNIREVSLLIIFYHHGHFLGPNLVAADGRE